MNKQEKQKFLSDVESVLSSVVKFMESYDDAAGFYYGYLHDIGVWECEFFNENDASILYFTSKSEKELIDTLSKARG